MILKNSSIKKVIHFTQLVCLMLMSVSLFGQQTLDAYIINVTTSNNVLIEYSSKLNELPECEPSNSLKAFELFSSLFKEESVEVRDTALLIYMGYFYNAYDYLECPDSKEYNSALFEEGLPDTNLINDINREYLSKYGYKIAPFHHGDIICVVDPDLIDSLFQDKVSSKAKTFLNYWFLREQSSLLDCSEGDCLYYLRNSGRVLIALENIILSDGFLAEELQKWYYINLIHFTLLPYNIYYRPNDTDYYILEPNLAKYYKSFQADHPNSKASKFLELVFHTIENLDAPQQLALIEYIISETCISEFSFDCVDSNLIYESFDMKIEEIISDFFEN